MIDTIVFDLGGVLIDWNPKYLFKKIFKTPEALDYFLNQVCTMEWNEMQDEGRSLTDATKLLQSEYPQYFTEIKLYYQKWEEMLGGTIQPTVELLESLVDTKKYKIYALTNWSAETFPIALNRYNFLALFEGILVSGVEGLKKPDPTIFNLLVDRYHLIPEKTLFIDDNEKNIITAQKLGFKTVHFVSVQDGVQNARNFVL